MQRLFDLISTLVEDDLTSLLQICNTSMAHQSGHWLIKSANEEHATIPEEDIYGDLMARGLKIGNQR